MKVERVVARTLPEALSKVRERLGPDAMILSTQMLRPAPWRFWERAGGVEVFAADDWPSPRFVSGQRGARSTSGAESASAGGTIGVRGGDAALSASTLSTPPRAETAASRAEAQSLSDLAHAVSELRREVEGIRTERARTWLSGSASEAPDRLRAVAEVLMERGVPAPLAEALAGRVGARVPQAVLSGVGGAGAALTEKEPDLGAGGSRSPRDEAFAALAEWLSERTDPNPHLPRVVALVGPTGAGKTTTLAKLTARAVLERGEKTAVVTADTYRIAAVDQLRTYADILGVPIRIAITPDDLSEAIEAFSDMDRIFIDTPGRNMRQPLSVAELTNLVRRANPDAVDLVIPAILAREEAEDLARTFSDTGLVTRMVISKWDEAARPATILGTLPILDRPLVCVTTGQTVPDDLAYPNAPELGRSILEGGLPG